MTLAGPQAGCLRRPSFLRLLLALANFLPNAAWPAYAQDAKEYRSVLYLSDIDPNWPVNTVLLESLRSAVNGSFPVQSVRIYTEYLNGPDAANPAFVGAVNTYFRMRYGSDQPDVIMAAGPYASNYVASWSESLFPRVPVVFVGDFAANITRYRLPTEFTGVSDSIDIGAAVDLALEMQPALETVYVVAGSSERDRWYADRARSDLARFEGLLRLEWLEGLTLGELERRLSRLPDRSIVLITQLSRDAAGTTLVPANGARRVAAASSVPAYGWIGTQIGNGVVGIRSFDIESLADTASSMVVRVLEGTPASSIPIQIFAPDLSVIDWNLAGRWHISADRFPDEAVILNRNPSPFEQYRGEIFGAAGVFAVLSVLIIALLVQASYRRLAEQAAHRKDAALQTSLDQVRSLAHRLITAQETERSRIARSLHDDVKQQLAAVSIRLAALGQTLPDSDTESRQDVDWLLTQTDALARTVRTMSHELHPAVLQHAGLEAALHSTASRLDGQNGLNVAFQSDADARHIGDSVALTIFRIAQEALSNAVQHAHASHIDVELTGDGEVLCLEVADDGCGFDASTGAITGLGFVSMRERLAAHSGELVIESTPGVGTRVLARVALRGSTEASPRAHNAAVQPPRRVGRDADPGQPVPPRRRSLMRFTGKPSAPDEPPAIRPS